MTKRFSISYALALVIGLMATISPTPVWADSQSDSISALETHLFFTTYPKENLADRLSRLEKQVFGQSLDGSVTERVSRLAAIAPIPVEAQPLSVVKPRQETAGNGSTLHEDECYLERAKVAVMAAKEEEITGLLAQGVELWRAKRAADALERFEHVVRLDPQNAEAHFSMGIIEEASGNLAAALSSYKLAVDSRPDNMDYKNALAGTQKKLAGRQKVDDRQSEIRQLTQEALSAFKRGEYMSALELYKTLDDKNPHQALTKYNIGTVYLMIKLPEKALLYYQQAHKLDPQDQRFTAALNKLNGVVQQNQGALAQMGANTKYHPSAGSSSSSPTNSEKQSAMASYGILGKTADDGVFITTIGIASRAMQVGLQRGDIIRAVDGTIVKNPGELNQILSRKTPKSPVQLMVQRQNSLTPVIL